MFELVGGTRIELVTPSMSRKCSTAELTARFASVALASSELYGSGGRTTTSSHHWGLMAGPAPLARHHNPFRISEHERLFAQLVDLIAEPGGILELQVLRVLVHLRLHLLQHTRRLLGVERGILGALLGHGAAA
jgi:hypothetical protein